MESWVKGMGGNRGIEMQNAPFKPEAPPPKAYLLLSWRKVNNLIDSSHAFEISGDP